MIIYTGRMKFPNNYFETNVINNYIKTIDTRIEREIKITLQNTKKEENNNKLR